MTESLPWRPPLAVAAALGAGQEEWAFLHSGQRWTHTGRHSYLALYPQETVTASDWTALAPRLGAGREPTENAWFGYLGYELPFEAASFDDPRGYITLANLRFTRFGLILQFDHQTGRVTARREPAVASPRWEEIGEENPLPPPPAIVSLESPMSRAEYLAAVEATREEIAKGEFYQANITRKFTGDFAQPPNSFGLFRRLCAASPAAYSAFLAFDGKAILSSSPERFLTVSADGRMETRPIKGTAPRFADPLQDERSRAALAASVKDRAENLMIVDLMRNDLSRAAEEGSVEVESLFEIFSYATLHHMASTIAARKRAHVSTLEAVRLAFPPGSMTGAPKRRAVEWCRARENIRRGVYGGALGWFGGDGSCDLSVVIRTLVLDGQRFEFQVGGGIVADSESTAEWRETLLKARGICAALGLDEYRLAAL